MSAVVGVIGGMGPAGTFDFLLRVTSATPARRDQDHLHVLVDGDPSVPDRSEALLGRGPDPTPWLVRAAVGLEAAGAELLVMPCNTAHAYAEDVRRAITVPLVDWPTEVAKAASKIHADQIALFATSGTVVSGMYQSVFAKFGRHLSIPDAETQSSIETAIRAVKCGGPSSQPALACVSAALDLLTCRPASAVLLACTELSSIAGGPLGRDLRRQAEGHGLVLIDSSSLMAEVVVRRALTYSRL